MKMYLEGVPEKESGTPSIILKLLSLMLYYLATFVIFEK